jgi:hypothetical protein
MLARLRRVLMLWSSPHACAVCLTAVVQQVIEAMAQERSHQTRVFDTLTAKLSTGSVMPVGAGSGGASGSATVGGYSSTRGGSTPARHLGYAK